MKKIIIAVVSLVTAFSGIGPVGAMPLPKVQPVQTVTDVQKVQDGIIIRRHGARRGHDYRGGRNWRGNRHWRGRHSGYRYDRRYRGRYYRDRGIGVPLGAFAAGAIIGGALNSQPRYARPAYRRAYGGNAHVSWCHARYRSYRAYDNTYQPYNGSRRQCNSPY